MTHVEGTRGFLSKNILEGPEYGTQDERITRKAKAFEEIERIESLHSEPRFSRQVDACVDKLSAPEFKRSDLPNSDIMTGAAMTLSESGSPAPLTRIRNEDISSDAFHIFLAELVMDVPQTSDPKHIHHAVDVFKSSYHLLTPPFDHEVVRTLWDSVARNEILTRSEKLFLQSEAIAHIKNPRKRMHFRALSQSTKTHESSDPTLSSAAIDIIEFDWLATSLARRYEGKGVPFEDLRQVARIGLVKSGMRYVSEYGTSFESFAVPTILGELKRHFRDNQWHAKVPRRAKELYIKLKTKHDDFIDEHNREPSNTELAEYAGITVTDVENGQLASMAYRASSLDDGSRVGHRSRAEYDQTDEPLNEERDDYELLDDRVLIEKFLNELPERERKVIYLRFFKEKTQSEIAPEVGISQVHVSRLIRRSLAALRTAFQNDD